jgi:hypothetical protein
MFSETCYVFPEMLGRDYNCYEEVKVSEGVYSIPVEFIIMEAVRQRRCELPVKTRGLEVF